MKLAPFLKEITLQPLSFLPMVDLKNDGDEYYVFNYENIIKNLKGFKHIIAKHLGIPISPELNNFLAYYVNELQEMEHAGETDVYADITFQEFLDDIKGVHEYSSPEDWVPNPNYDIYSVADLQEITLSTPIRIKLTTPRYGQMYIEGKPIGIEKNLGDGYHLDEYDEEVYNRYGITFNIPDDEDDYYPVEESEKLVQILLPKLKHLGAKIEDNGYGVKIIVIPEESVMSLVQADYPIYLGNGKFEYKGKTITYKQASPGSREYQVYNSNGDLIKTITSPNNNFDSFMSFLSHTGQTEWQRENSPYGIITSLTEITLRPNFTIDPNPVYGMSSTATDIFGVDHLMQLVDLGNYYTIMPYGNQPFVILIPKQYIKNITPLPTHKPLNPKEMDQIKDLVSQGKTEIVKPIQTESAKSFKDLLIKSYQQKVKSIINEYVQQALKEYSEATIKNLFNKWGIDPTTNSDDATKARAVITRFDQIKDKLPEKKAILVIPDELKNKDIRNIELYSSLKDLEDLVKSYPENPDKQKKEAVKNFVEKEFIDKATAQAYVARFFNNKDTLKYALEQGLEDLGFTKEQIRSYIPPRLLNNNAYLDPRNWKWESFERMMDAIFPSQKKVEGETNLAETDADKVYDKDGIEIYKGDTIHKCISYNPVLATGRKKYGWCVTQVGNTNYDFYRLGKETPTFYFVFDRSKDSSPEHAPFKDQWHAFAIQVTEDTKTYIVTGADNRSDTRTKPGTGWEGIAEIVPPDTWAKIKNLKDYFKPVSLSAQELGKKFAQGKNLTVAEFKALSQDDKILYIQGKSEKSQLSPEILELLPQYKIPYEGRSTTLANIAIDSGQKFTYKDLKNYPALAKRYAIFRFRHTNYGKEPIPLPFVQYLDEDSKEKYLKTFNGNLTFEYIDKYFGPEVAEKYVDAELKKLGFLPQAAVKYIKNPKLKQLFELYSKLFSGWGFSDSTNMDEEKLEALSIMPQQTALITPFTQQQWINLSSQERVSIIKLVEQFNKNSTYDALLYGAPFLIKDGAKTYVLAANKSEYPDEFALMDEQGRIVKDNIPSTSELGPINLTSPYPEEDFNKIYDIKDLKVA